MKVLRLLPTRLLGCAVRLREMRLAATLLLAAAGCRGPMSSPAVSHVSLPAAVSDSAQVNSAAESAVPLPPVESASATTGPIVPVAYDEPAAVAVPRPEPIASGDPEAIPGLWTLEAFEELGLSNSPAVAEAAAQVQAAYGNWIQVGLPPNLELGYSGQQLGSRGQAEQQGVYIGQEIVTAHKLRLNRHVASWEMQRADRELTIQQFRVLTDVRLAYGEVVIAQRRRKLARQLVEIGERAARAAEALFKAQEVSEADPLRARIEADAAQIVLRNAENQYLAAWRTLAAAAGVPDMLPVDLPDELDPEPIVGEWEELLPQLLAESPEIAAAWAQVESAHWAVHRATAEVVPNIDVQAIVQHDNATQSSNGNLQVTLPIPLLNRNQGRIQQARAELSAAQLAVDRVTLDLQTRFADTFQRYANARHQVERYTAPQGMLDNALRTMELIRSGYEAGEFSVLDLLTAQRTYFQTNLGYLDSLRELWIASTEIRGLLLRGSLAQR